jgi:hypothetical protein
MHGTIGAISVPSVTERPALPTFPPRSWHRPDRLDARPVIWSLDNHPEEWEPADERPYWLLLHKPSGHVFRIAGGLARLTAPDECSCLRASGGYFQLFQGVRIKASGASLDSTARQSGSRGASEPRAIRRSLCSLSPPMNLDRLHAILADTTVQLRKGEMVHGDKHLVDAIKQGRDLDKEMGGVVTIDAMPHVRQFANARGFAKVDMEFLVIGVDTAAAERHKAELIEILKDYPQPERLAAGPSYIEIGAEIGDQGAAFQLFALGKVLGLWSVITPATMGCTGAEARQMAGRGFVMMSGYRA